MTVAELIEYLKTQPQDLPVVYNLHSEYCSFEHAYPQVIEACISRPDGWIQRKRPDKPTQKYFLIT